MTRPKLLDALAGGRRALIEDRFWSHVDRRGADECWEWIASRRANGYGQVSISRHPFKAHRVSFFLAHGWEPPMVLHDCDNRPCVNPAHLRAGTHKDNMADCAAKGRMARQLDSSTRTAVVELARSGFSGRGIARHLAISHRSVGRILKGVSHGATQVA